MTTNIEGSVFDIAPKSQMISRTFHLDEKQLEPLHDVSKAMGISQSEVVRRAISHFIQDFERHAKKLRKKPS